MNLLFLVLVSFSHGHPCSIDKVMHLDTGECLNYCPNGSQYDILYNRSLCYYCPKGKFSDKNNSNCVDWSDCNSKIGEYVFQEGSSSSDRICSCPYFLVESETCIHNCSQISYYYEENLDNTSRYEYNCYKNNITVYDEPQASENEVTFGLISIFLGGLALLTFLVYMILKCRKRYFCKN